VSAAASIARAHADSRGFEDIENARAGITWWNNLSRAERRYWLEAANSAVPADAWQAYRR
jgi:hypothetical protein